MATSRTMANIHGAVLRKIRALGLERNSEVLDAPCGEGELAVLLEKEGFHVSGADIVKNLNPEAAAALGDRFRVADLNAPLPWPDGSFDLAVCVEGVEHLENAFAFLREAHRACKAGGTLIITTPNIASIRSRMRYLGSSFYTQDPRPLDESERHPLHHIGLRTFWEWRYVLHACGFQLREAAHTHVKPISYLYGILAPWMWLYTRIAFRKEKDEAQRERNREILRALTSPAVLFSENLMLVAKKS